ncbi:variant erythrocyte surface antigen-1 family protein [Babesia caballi]|uniref:Variant erythrocyte surface antigen-1 family protein n=1 Tax=Babesia caballi TaxID=5871 RepID=A0AAV4LMK5_BABCB|nr:variant erythrocyte surface antigen-1 family protein [Babesia caballi]
MAKKDLTDCPSNLKEAIDWVLRVTGKDGGTSCDATSKLANAVKGLLQSALNDVNSLIGNSHNNDTKLQRLKQGLEKAKDLVEKDVEGDSRFEHVGTGGPVGMLAEGLRKFIGYKGSIFTNTNGQITGAGIAPSNMATHRLCDATIAFTIGVLEGCQKNSDLTNHTNSALLRQVNDSIKKIQGCYGKGPVELKKLANEKCGLATFSGSNVGQFVQQLGKAFDTQFNTLNGVNDQPRKVAEKVGEYLKEVLNGAKAWGGDAQNAGTHLKTLVRNFTGETLYDSINDKNFDTNIKQVKSAVNPGGAKLDSVKKSLEYGKNAFMNQLEMRNYIQTDYQKVNLLEFTNETGKIQTCAKIFLSCLPLYYQALTYLYWRCHNNGGGWNAMTLGGGPLKDFLYSMWYDPSRLHVVKRGQSVVSSLDDKFKDFQQKMQAASNKSYPQFLKELQENARQKLTGSSTENCPLSALYYCASCYFTCKQSQINAPTKSPSTIREMLYFLAALPFSPSYDEFDTYLTNHFKTLIPRDAAQSGPDNRQDHELALDVADSATASRQNKLSADHIKDYLTSSLLLPPVLLGAIQGNSTDDPNDPWLHRLYCNTHIDLKFPSSPSALFNALSSYAYALHFQLGFLYQQCSQLYVNTCGWFMCTFGQGVNESPKGRIVSSHICSVGCSNHRSDKFSEHTGYCQHSDCGTSASKPSPLQAFLTDTLTGFSRGHPSSHSGHLAECSGYTCHVPMGFKAKNLRPGSKYQGGHITIALTPFCGSYTCPLPQLSEKLGCLVKRTPRSLGDIFGFIWTLNSQLFKSKPDVNNTINDFFMSIGLRREFQKLQTDPSSAYTSVCDTIAKLPSSNPPKGVQSALKTLFLGLPFWYNIFMVNPDGSLPVRLFELKSTDHSPRYSYSGKHDDLYSLYNPLCTDSANNTCGTYLYPLCYSNGATFNPKSAITYLSWVLYLTDDLQSWFQAMLDEFKNIDCSTSGCGGQSKCQVTHKSGTHGTDSVACSCYSVVQCGGVLPLLYRHGFRFYDAIHLKNGFRGEGKDIRQCKAFGEQLKSVISGKPLTNLLTSIDAFLYAIRLEFFSKLSAFWTIYIGLILYTFLFLLDTLHLRSHLKLTSSHMVPPLALLTSGTPLPITNLTYIGQ